MLVYKVTNKHNGKCYIGQTRGALADRKQAHLRSARDFPRKGRYFQWALREFGEDSFTWEVLCRCITAEELDEREREFIRRFKADDPDRGYNLVPGGGSRPSESLAQALAALRPRDVVLTQSLLDTMGISAKLAAWYVQAGWLIRCGPRAFVRPGDSVDWRSGLYALQTQLGLTIHAAARTALELRGLAHFVPQGSSQRIQLISDRKERLPAWFREREWKPQVEHHTLSLFEEATEESLTHLDCGGFEISMSAPERASLEEMALAKQNATIEYAVQLMENLPSLRPQLVQALLERCTSVKAKRLFLWSAERAGHPWLASLDRERIDLGSVQWGQVLFFDIRGSTWRLRATNTLCSPRCAHHRAIHGLLHPDNEVLERIAREAHHYAFQNPRRRSTFPR